VSAPAAWITGGGRGIGAGIAAALASNGWRCAVTARSRDEVERTAAALPGAIAVPADVADQAQVAAAASHVAAAFGRLDLLVLSAGIGTFGPLRSFAAADLDQLHAVNVRGTLLCCQAALPLMARGATIIGIGSVMSVQTYRNQGAYAASKHAMQALLKTLAKEVAADGIRVATVLPGGVDTAMVRASRPDLDPSTLIRVEDVARAVVHAATMSETCWTDEIRLRRAGSEPFAGI
jgi:3-oxoacyl-[acyl-carrier protein] reductase